MKHRTLVIMMILISLLLAAFLLVVGLTAEAEPAQSARHLPEGLPWATVMQTAPIHDGPGLRYAVTGTIPAGTGVEVLAEVDGWMKCWYYAQLDKPVWICGEYLELEE